MAAGNKRIHELAKAWDVASKDVVERLEKMGVTGKKAQSSLTEMEAQRVYEAMGLAKAAEPEMPVVTTTVEVGAAGVSETTTTETKLKTGVKRRRVKRSGAGADAAGRAGLGIVPRRLRRHVVTAGDIPPDDLASFDPSNFAYASMPVRAALAAQESAPEPAFEPPAEVAPLTDILPEAVEADDHVAEESAEAIPAADAIDASPAVAPDAEPASVEPTPVPDRIAATPTPTPTPTSTPTPTPTPEPTEPAVAAAAEPDDEPVHAPVDEPDKLAEELLRAAEVKEGGAKAGAEGGDAQPQPVRAGAARVLGRIDLKAKQKPVQPEKKAEEEKKDDADKTGRKRKRKVVRKEDMFDAFERSFQARNRRPIKRRVAPGQKIQKTELTTPKASKRVIKINEVATAGELAKGMGVKAGDVLGALMRLGAMKSINDAIDAETAELVADEFGYRIENTAVSVEELLQVGDESETADVPLEPRPPVVTVMGHVDHGKTSLLDVIRETNVVSGEAGGITQHIGAYLVPTSQGEICFLDTPGHAAFTSMRARGASITDMVVLVVAADDGVMPQTVEAINHAKAAEIPVVVAVNKMDKPDANPDRVKQQLSEYGLQPEDWGGDTQFVPVSALKNDGVDALLESIALAAQMLELKAPVDRPAHGTVIESRLDKGRGPVATVLVEQGTLKRGDHYVVGRATGRVRAMTDHTGRQVKKAGPSHAVEIIGIDSVPQAGDAFDAVEDAGKAEKIAEHRRDSGRKQQAVNTARMSLEDLQAQVAAGDVGELKVILKADVHGSGEALKQALEKLSTSEVKLDVIHLAVGAINESDVQLAMASQAIIIGFHVRPEGKARTLAEREGVDLRLHTIIYEAIDEMKAALEGLLAPDFREAFEGRAEVRDTFSVPGGVTIAGCLVTEGKVSRTSQCRLLRDNVVIHTGSVGSLRRFKDDVKEVASGVECGIGIDRYNDLKPADVIECFKMEEVKRSLDDSAGGASAGATA